MTLDKSVYVACLFASYTGNGKRLCLILIEYCKRFRLDIKNVNIYSLRLFSVY